MRVVELDDYAAQTLFAVNLDPIYIDYARIDRDFCCRLSTMEWEDRSIFFKLLTDTFTYKNLGAFHQSDEESSEEFDEDNADEIWKKKVSQVNIAQEEIEIADFRTIYVMGSDGYRYPVMFHLITVLGTPIGVKIFKYDCEDSGVHQIAMLIIHPRKCLNCTFLTR